MARTARAPRNSTNERSVRRPAAAHTAQIAMRAGHGNATAEIVIARTRNSQANQAKAARREGSSSIRVDEHSAERGVARVGRDIAGNEIPRDVGVGQFEKLGEGDAFIAWRRCVPVAQITHEQKVQLFHAAAAAPSQALARHDGKRRRSVAVRKIRRRFLHG
jgi:hypothetical protein